MAAAVVRRPVAFGLQAPRVPFSSVAIPVSSVKQLREMTGAPMLECKNALVAEDGDVEKAAALLRKKGMAIAGKKSGREASQGLVAVKVSDGGDTAAIVEVRGCPLQRYRPERHLFFAFMSLPLSSCAVQQRD